MAADPCSSSSSRVQVMAAVVVVVAACLGATAKGFDICPSVNILVYPLGARCVREPAVYYGEEVYEFGVLSSIGSIQGYLAPEWDETNATFYVRSAEVGAKYAFTHLFTFENRNAVSQSHDVIIYNIETKRPLGWRRDGDEWFLVEGQADPPSSQNFQLANAPHTSTPSSQNFQLANAPHTSTVLCRSSQPHITCEFYFLLEYGTSLGASPYLQDGVTYFKLSDISTLPLNDRQSFALFRNTPSLHTPNPII